MLKTTYLKLFKTIWVGDLKTLYRVQKMELFVLPGNTWYYLKLFEWEILKHFIGCKKWNYLYCQVIL